jgi:hypothetical protein
MRHHSAILRALEGLTESQQAILLEMATCLLREVRCQVDPSSDIVTPLFRENIANRLLLHHATNEELFKKKPFEYAFKAACEADGKNASIVDSQTNPGADVIVNGTKFSLKSEAAAGISATHITISKLMEARWIRECATNDDFARETRARVGRHLREYERVLMLRASTTGGRNVVYELVEIPRDLLLAVESVRPTDFGTRTRNGSNSATIRYNGVDAFTLRLDGSVEKVTVSRLAKRLCRAHATWVIPG